jgi:hypothetical protein
LLLRESGVTQNENPDLRLVIGEGHEDGGVAHGRLLVRFAEAALGGGRDALATARSALLRAVGPAGLVDAAAVVGLFNAIDRVADAIGIPLEPEKAAASADFRTALGIDHFAVADRAQQSKDQA